MHSGDGSIGVEVRNLTLYGNPYGFKKRILYEKRQLLKEKKTR